MKRIFKNAHFTSLGIILMGLGLALCACTNTRAGLTQDAERFGERMQKVGQALTDP